MSLKSCKQLRALSTSMIAYGYTDDKKIPPLKLTYGAYFPSRGNLEAGTCDLATHQASKRQRTSLEAFLMNCM